MFVDSVTFCGHRCFKTGWSGFDTIKPINVLIGRTNTGKTHLLDLAESLCTLPLHKEGWRYRCRGTLYEQSLRQHFLPHQAGGALENNPRGNWWADHGQHFGGKEISWETYGRTPSQITFAAPSNPESPVRKH